MRVISMVPSLTETLLENSVEVVGRTRFCVHPKAQVANIPVVGGTKDLNMPLIEKLQPDLIILDREENKKEMADSLRFPLHVTHVEDHASLALELRRFAKVFSKPSLTEWADLAEACCAQQQNWDWASMPGVQPSDFLTLSENSTNFKMPKKLHYVIWKNPWMAVSRETFIGSTLSILGAGDLLVPSTKKYFEFDWALESQDPENFFLYSSEPYPFHLKPAEKSKSGGALVDGEAYSWFGVRNLRFLARTLRLSSVL